MKRVKAKSEGLDGATLILMFQEYWAGETRGFHRLGQKCRGTAANLNPRPYRLRITANMHQRLDSYTSNVSFPL